MIRDRVAMTLATWFGIGYVPGAPGTAGALAALLIGLLMVEFGGWGQVHLLAMAAVATTPAIWAAGRCAIVAGRKDPSIVVIDEVLGTWIAMAGAVRFNWQSYVAAFALFRLFDIWKPWPIRRLESLPGGRGIIADDALAGVYAALVLFLAGCFNLY